MATNELKYISDFLEHEAQSCEWFAKGIELGKVAKATSTPQELYAKADYFRKVKATIEQYIK